MQMDHAALEAAFVHQLEVHADMVGQGLVAASHDDRRDEQAELVHETGPDRLRGEVWTTHRDVTPG
jgi:hypothetical protein